MSWTAPRTMAVGTTGTAADWNTYIRDNETWLRTGMTQNQPVRNGNTAYQNTTDGTITILAQISAFFGDLAYVKCGSTSTPSTGGILLGQFGCQGATTNSYYLPVLFPVPAAYYYIIEITGIAIVAAATEYRF